MVQRSICCCGQVWIQKEEICHCAKSGPIQLPCGVVTISRVCLHYMYIYIYMIIYIYIYACVFWGIYIVAMIDICLLFPPFIFSSASPAHLRQHQGPRHLARPVLNFANHSVSHEIDRKFINMRSFVVITNVGFICGLTLIQFYIALWSCYKTPPILCQPF